ncbi:response regulator transcription factor [Rhodoferax sp. BAB1]|uniref:response regulator transcription factor n=1 Tax=Rhodoferax sp. BAB1 TaxID=2741720 RepID=UPI001576CF7F|nr:response regulator transcription factor [Rhodoferax sp. BAB1]QKO21376.1 response regulator transcription factor [Rhodoferax sp. BAB1]
MAQVILLEDEPVLREELTEFLQAQGHRVTVSSTVAEFMRVFKPREHQVAVLDRGLPDGDGLDLILRMRSNGLRLGIIMLTARAGMQDKVDGLIGGADHYIPKTADLSELAATIAALARRLDVQEQPRWLLQASPRQLTPPGQAPITLSAQDYLVLKTLALGGESVSREAIVLALGADYFDYDMRRLDTQMRRLRRKVHEACGLELPVSTLRAVGYSFHAPIEVRP